ncbi:MAG TPA: transglutaminase domain-containing protein [Chitinophagaceae bacterium]|jgi:hypothetical protein|nr:transglutaminase domain-containing protein [Chitinophagaceae bacterium]
MKTAMMIAFLLLAFPVFSQTTGSTIDFTNASDLARQLTAACSTDRQKVTTIFHWITDNIAYSTGPARSASKRKNKPVVIHEEETDDGLALPALSDRVAIKVLTDKKAVCEGYSRLFYSLCEHAGLQSALITGYARVDMNRQESKFRSNHCWNAVMIDSAWYLLDATWAAGYIAMPSGEFVKRYDPYYFLTPPEQFIRHHYPDDLRWSLLADLPVMGEFRSTPFRQRSYGKYGITSYWPSKGIIEANLGDTIRLELETSWLTKPDIASDSLWERGYRDSAAMYAYVMPDKEQHGSKVYYQFAVSSENVQWLHLMYNDDAVLRYRINVRRKTASEQ